MNRRRSPYALGFLAAVFVGCSVILIVYWQSRVLPAPEHANLNQVFYWLVARDLNDYSVDVRRSLLSRLEQEASRNENLDGEVIELPHEYQTQLTANTELLRDDWFTWQLENYQVCPVEQRPALLTRCLDAINQWMKFQRRLGGEADSNDLFGVVESLTGSLPAQRLELADQMISETVLIWLSREDLQAVDFELRRELATRIATRLEREFTAFRAGASELDHGTGRTTPQ